MNNGLNLINKKVDIKNRIIKIMLVFIYIFSFLVLGLFIFSIFNDKYEFYIINESNTVILGNDFQVELIKKHGEINDYSEYEWTVKDTNIAKVDKYGLITGLSEGITELKIKSKKGYAVKIMQLEVKNMEVTSIVFNENVSLEVNEVYKLNPLVNEKGNLNDLLSYESSNSNIVQVDSSGVVRAIGEGEAIIKAFSNDIIAECKIIVKAKKENHIQNIKFNQSTISMKIGTKTKLTPIIEPSDLSDLELVWNSNNDVVSVDKNGNIVAKRIGQAIVTVRGINGKTATCKVIVTDNNVPAGEIRFEKNSYTVNQGDEFFLPTIISPSDATNRELNWTSSDATIAKVENGKVTGLKAGTATITVKTHNGKTATCKVTVSKKNTIVNATGISLNITSKSIYVGDNFTLKATILPSNATNKNVTWTSSDATIAKVENGKVTGLKAGTAKITVKTNNGKTTTCKVTVSKKTVAVTGVKLDSTSKSINVGDSFTLKATISPSNATNKNVTWSSSDATIAKVENGKVTGLKAGTATITVKTNNGKTATCKVTVSKKSTTVAVTGVTLNLTKKSIYVGEAFNLTATVAPSNATNKNVTWTSSDSTIAKVENGKVTGLKAGTATITVKTNNGKTATSKVTVVKNTFTNPIRGGADPWMIQKNGYYYTTYTNGRKEIVIYKSTKLHDFAKNGKTVYISDFNTSNKGIWAPELHYLNGKWYIYYADTTDGQTSNRRMHVLESKTQDPQGEYVYKGIIARGHQAIDGTVLNWSNQLYFLWSGREPSTTATQRIYIAKMSDPWTITGDIVMISSPQYSWEKQAGPVNEGPQVLIKNGTLHIIYSASGASSIGYCFGILTYKGSGSLLNASNWTKTSTPIFKAGNSVYGPGHGSFVKSPDGKEDWVVYHAYTKPEDAKNWDRNIRVQKFTWNGNIPNFGTPVATGSEIIIPSGTKY